MFLGQAPAAPNTPPAGANLSNPFVTGLLSYPNTLIGSGIGAVFPNWLTPLTSNGMPVSNSTFFQAICWWKLRTLGSRGEHIWTNIGADAADPQYLSLGSQLNALVPNPFYGKITSGSLSTATVRQSSLLIPYPQYTSINNIRASVGDSVYHAFTLRADKRFTHGLLFQSSYTFSKLIDNVQERFGGRSSFTNPYNLNQSRSVSDQDRSQIFVTNFVYELPVGTGKHWAGKGSRVRRWATGR